MKSIVAFLLAIAAPSICLGQTELIRNGRFDSVLWIPQSLQQFGDTFPALHWTGDNTPDLFHYSAPWAVSVPSNQFGTTGPMDSCYAGFLGMFYADSTSYYPSGERITQRIGPIGAGTEVTLSFDVFRSQWPGPACGFEIVVGSDTIRTPLFNDHAWVRHTTTFTVSSIADTIKIGAGGNIGPYPGEGILYGYYYLDNISLVLTSATGTEEPTELPKDDPTIRDLLGREVAIPQPETLYIRNGKKFVICPK